MKYFLCNKIGHFASRCPNRVPKYKPKFKKSAFNNEECYYASDGVTNDEYELEDVEIGFVAITKENSIKEEKTLVSQVDKESKWIIDSGCSHHMTSDKNKFVELAMFDGGVVRFGDNTPKSIIGIGSITLDGKINTDDVFLVEGLKHNLLSVSQLVGKGYILEFKDGKCFIRNQMGRLIASRNLSRGNVYELNTTIGKCLVARIDDSWLWHKRFCYINFDNMVKISRINAVSDLPRIDKPSNIMCRECVMGKQTK